MNETWMRLTWGVSQFPTMPVTMLVREHDVMKFVEALSTLGFTPEVTFEDNPTGKLSVEGVRIQA